MLVKKLKIAMLKLTPLPHHCKHCLAALLLASTALYAYLTLNAEPWHAPYTKDPVKTAKGDALIPRQAFVIALDKSVGAQLSELINQTLQITTHPILADRGVIHRKDLHIFTRYMMDTGRVDHKLMDNWAMVGCLMSHVQIWKTLTEPAIIFEEDSIVTGVTRQLLANIMLEAHPHNWSALMLTKRYYKRYPEPQETTLSPLLATCKTCSWFGTRAYIITPIGASIMLEYYLPLLVQVDGLMSLVNTYDPRFKMLWVRGEVVTKQEYRSSTIQTAPCQKCYHLVDYLDPRRW